MAGIIDKTSNIYTQPIEVIYDAFLRALKKGKVSSNEVFNVAAALEPGERHDRLLNLALENKVNFNNVTSSNVSLSIDDLEKCLNYEFTPNLILEYAINNHLLDIAKFALKHKANPSAISLKKQFTIMTIAIINKNIDMIDLLIAESEKIEINAFEYIGLVVNLDFNFITKIIDKIPNSYSKDEIYQILRANGFSQSDTFCYLDLYDLVREYALSRQGKPTSLGEMDLKILDNIYIEDFQNIQLTNKYGYGPLHLSIIARGYDFAATLIRNNFDIFARNNHNTIPLQLLPDNSNKNSASLIVIILEVMDNVDIDLGFGETLADKLLKNDKLSKATIKLSNDRLFVFLKEGADLFSPSKNQGNTYIAISDGEGFWSAGIWSAARLIMNNYPNIIFHLVRDNMLKEGGEAFIKQFDAVINPGAGDSYPQGLQEFTKANCPLTLPLEVHYQNILDQSNKFNIPYLGMCAGAQHFSIYHGGSLRPLEGYSSGQHQIRYIEGSLAYFMTLTKEQQNRALSDCYFPKISFIGDTAHHYAAVHDKLGNNMQLGAISEDYVAMAFANNNGIRYATQFHPEHYYGKNDDNAIHQQAWLDNFIGIAQMHHDYRVNNGIHPIEYYAKVKARLDECLSGGSSDGEDLIYFLP